MPMTIPQYAADRHISRQAVYKVLEKKTEINKLTYTGKSNGKDAKFLSDEAIGMLDQSIKMPYANVEDASRELSLLYTQEENKLLKAQNLIRDKLEGVQDKLAQEVTATRRELIETSEKHYEALLEKFEHVSNSYITKADIQDLYKQLSEAQTTITKLTQMLEEADRDKKLMAEEISRYKAEAGKYHKLIFGLYKKEN